MPFHVLSTSKCGPLPLFPISGSVAAIQFSVLTYHFIRRQKDNGRGDGQLTGYRCLERSALMPKPPVQALGGLPEDQILCEWKGIFSGKNPTSFQPVVLILEQFIWSKAASLAPIEALWEKAGLR
ncbi:hypothetical protein CCM_04811 [Cordyceps militaris CM01]|uniref:Uncharacterized protein n=1 Tax=Cordyceps militaris (strain CM01) TaxID=983644 RepID=G3JEP0_CORMM|nr:uncharacterized protein CCM_04811 [Cordyceps militaris CM01]EGX93437.1 hypothetical protein CCM_04811 [Cordyceps militaris CM01]